MRRTSLDLPRSARRFDRARISGLRWNFASEQSRESSQDMFENLTEKLQRTFKNLRGQGKLTDETWTPRWRRFARRCWKAT